MSRRPMPEVSRATNSPKTSTTACGHTSLNSRTSKRNFGIGNSAYASVEFGKTTIAKGANISIDSVVEGPSVPGTYQQPIYIDTAVKVQSVTTQLGEKGSTNWIGFTFETVPGHVLNPATISFQMRDFGPGNIDFAINVNGNFADLTSEARYYLGGYDLEDTIWNHVIDNVERYCGHEPSK
jgi:hypothetical protein